MISEDIEYLRTKPNFKKYLDGGSQVRTIRTIYPSVTYPAHVSMMTGCYPEKTGVCSNFAFTTNSKEDTWLWFHENVKCGDIFTAAKRGGYSTGAVFWPVLGNHPDIDYNINEYWMPKKGDTLRSSFERVGANEACLEIIESNAHLLPESYKLTGRKNFCVQPYVDNFLIEGVYDIPDLIYPMIEKKVPTATTGTPLTAPVLEGENLALGSKVTTAANSIGKSVAANIVDGDLTTRYQASFNKSLVSLNGIQNEIVIDLGSVKTFDTYTLVNAGYSMADNFSTKEWEVLVSEDGKTYTAVDYQKDSKMDAVSVNIGTQKARYVKIYVYTADNANTGTTRILEFMLFKQQ